MDYKEIFDRYLDGSLSGEELRDLEKKLNEDPELAGELEQYKKLHSVSEALFADETVDRQAKEDIAGFRDKDLNKDMDLKQFKEVLENSGRRRFVPLWYVAAVVLVGMITFAIFQLADNKTGLPELYAEYYESYQQSETTFEFTRSNDDLYFAVQVFESGDYSRATVLFKQLADSSVFSPYSSFYLGLIFMNRENWENAIGKLNQVIETGNHDLLPDARWYLGLCYLRIENAQEARKQFKYLSEIENGYSRRARKILKHLD